MSKFYNSPVQVNLDASGRPCKIMWRGRWFDVSYCYFYELNQHWWGKVKDPFPPRFRCETKDGMVCDLYFSNPPGVWILERIFD